MPKRTDKEFLIRVRADIKQAVRDMRRMTEEVKTQSASMKRGAGANGAMAGAYKRMASAAAAYLTVATAINALRMADEWQAQAQKLRAVTDGTQDLTNLLGDLYGIAKRNGVAMADTIDTYMRMGIAQQQLGATRSELLRVTEAVQQLGVISGTSQSAMANTMVQFGQMMTSTVVQAEEFNSLIDNTPLLVQRIAEGLGMTVGELIQAVKHGKVLSRDVFAALLKQTGDIAEEAAAVPDNLESASTRLSNAFGRFLTQLDQALGGARTLASILSGIAQSLDNWGDAFDPNGQRAFNALIERREQLMARIADLQGRTDRESRVAANAARRELIQVRAEIARIQAVNIQRLRSESSADQRPVTTAGTDRGADEDRHREAIERTIRALELEAATFGKTATDAQLYALALDGASESQLDRAAAALLTVERLQKEAAAEAATAEALAAARRERESNVTSLEAYRRAVLDAADPTRRMQEELDRLRQLMIQFPDDADLIQKRMAQVANNIERVTKSTNDQMTQFTIQAARNMQSAFADGFFDMMNGEMDSMADRFARMLQRMAADLAASQLLNFLFGADFGKTGKIGGFIGSMFKHHSGGLAGQGTRTSANMLMFANAPRYHAGGLAGDEVPAILRRGEEVLTRSDPRHRYNLSGNMAIAVEIRNSGAGKQISDAGARIDAGRLILSVMTEDLQRGGPYSRQFASTFNLKR